ncbi:MAG TPA: IS3 family transposase [Aggregatilineales bacterium]|nr:IS3 family transposase [Aggregatilineales bacterium]
MVGRVWWSLGAGVAVVHQSTLDRVVGAGLNRLSPCLPLGTLGLIGRRDALSEHLKEVFENSQQTYGSRRLRAALRQEGIRCGRGRIVRLMRQAGLAVLLKRRRVLTTTANPREAYGENKLARDFSATGPNQKWLVDITDVATDEGYLYLAAVLDLFSRNIVGWAMDDNLRDELTQSALRMALLTRAPEPGLLRHSDRGSQYTSAEYCALFEEAGIQVSLSRAHNCFDNAPMESFGGKLKTECLSRYHFKTRAQARTTIFAYLEGFFNRQRLHSPLNYQSPALFELACWTK